MKEEIYQWMKKSGGFYILFTAVLHLVPDNKYERYVRSFMGLLLIFMLCMPVFSIIGRSSELLESFGVHYEDEEGILKQRDLENLQAVYLQKGYEWELRKKIQDVLQNSGINTTDVSVHIEGENMAVTLYVQEELTAEQERGMEDALWTACGIREGEYQIQIVSDDAAAVDSAAVTGPSSGSGGAAGIP